MIQNWRSVHRWIRRVWITAGVGFVAWLVWNTQAHGVADALLATDRHVRVQATGNGFIFLPAQPTAEAALIFLPGGMVEPRAYAPLVRAIAAAGHPAAIVPLPYRMAPSEASRAELWQRIVSVRKTWGADRLTVLAGHSRGAILAGGFAARHATALGGLVMIGTTHPRDDDLWRRQKPRARTAGCCPAHTHWVEIPGANHAQFGYYGSQLNDCAATITREDQQRQLPVSLVTFLSLLTTTPGTGLHLSPEQRR